MLTSARAVGLVHSAVHVWQVSPQRSMRAASSARHASTPPSASGVARSRKNWYSLPARSGRR